MHINQLNQNVFSHTSSADWACSLKFTAIGGDVIGKDQCKKLQDFIMSMETAKDLGGLFELTTSR